MSERMVIWMDQTLSCAVQQSVLQEQLQALAGKLAELGNSCFDMDWTTWQKLDGQDLLKASLLNKLRCNVDAGEQQLESAASDGCRKIVISYALQPWRGKGGDLVKLLQISRAAGLDTALHIVNASEFAPATIRELYPIVKDNGLTSLIIGDRDSLFDPFAVQDFFRAIWMEQPCPLEFHGHNRYGLATANALAAFDCGVDRLALSVAGIGRTGHAAAEEVLLGAYRAGAVWNTDGNLAETCSEILASLDIKVPAGKAVIGEHIFSHESGIHVNGIVKNSQLYEAFAPETVGLSRRVVIGKHSGSTSLQAKFSEWGIPLDTKTTKTLLKKIRHLAVVKKTLIEEPQLKRMYYRLKRRSAMEVLRKGTDAVEKTDRTR